MYRTMAFVGVATAAITMAAAARAESPSELLEKGIYTEETAGDLDGAIAIYEKVVAEAKAGQALAAQAQFRLGQCLLKKDRKAEATAAFEKLIRDYPGEKELLAKARKFVPEGLPMGPVPWADGEVLQIDMRLTTGMDIGTVYYTSRSADLDGRKIWRVGSQTVAWVGNVYGASSVDADWDTFRPISSCFKMTPLGTFNARFSPSQVVVSSEGPDGKVTERTFDETQVVYDNEQAMDVMRRLPFAPDYKTTLPVFAAMGAGNILFPLEVKCVEKVKVPAGEFECFKVHLGMVNQDFWFSNDAHRYLVKFEAGAVIAELASVEQIKPGETRQYENAQCGFSLTSPNDWFFHVLREDKPGDVKAFILDPQGDAYTEMTVVKNADMKAEEQESLRKWMDGKVESLGKMKKDFVVRADSWQERTLAGRSTLSVVADWSGGKQKKVDFYAAVRIDAGVLFFAYSIPAAQFDDFRKQFDAIIDTLKVK